MDDGVWTLTETGAPTGGTFTITTVASVSGTLTGLTTGTIAFNASAATIASAVQTALAASITGATCTGTGGPINTTPVTLTVGNVNLGSSSGGSAMFTNVGGLTGGTSPNVTPVLSTASALFGSFILENPVFEADSLQWSKQSTIPDLFIRGLDQPVRRLIVTSPRIYLSNYTYDAGGANDLAFIHPLSYASSAWLQTVDVRDMDCILGTGCQFNFSGTARLHMIAPEGAHTHTNIDGLVTDWAGATGGGNFLMVGAVHNGGSSVKVNARRLKPMSVASGASNSGLRVYTGGARSRTC
jgi:hypothetical protein